MTPGARTIPGKPARRLGTLLVAQLHMGSSRAAEPEARTLENGGKAETEEESVTGLSSDRLVIRLRQTAEP